MGNAKRTEGEMRNTRQALDRSGPQRITAHGKAAGCFIRSFFFEVLLEPHSVQETRQNIV